MRSKLFLSYSHDDQVWRDRFLRYLKGIVTVGEKLWVDSASIKAGDDWERDITAALRESRCALLLLTPNYLDCGRYARRELTMALAQRQDDLIVLPVLVEPCLWRLVPDLARVQFVRWGAGKGELHDDLAVSEAGTDDRSIDRVVLEICQQIGKTLGVVGQTTTQQRNELFEKTRETLGDRVRLEETCVHTGDFAVVYRGTSVEGDAVAVKSVPDAPRQNRIRTVFEKAVAAAKKLRDPSFIRIFYAVVDRDPHCLVMDYVEWPTLEAVLAQRDGRRLPPDVVARVLAKIAWAQADAHENEFSLGPLSTGGIHVNPEDWEVRLSPIRIESQLARAASMATGQLLNWDALTHLSPEVSRGHVPSTRDELDAHGQYYLALLGLELLLGHQPFEVRCFDDLLRRPRFFDDPRGFFDAPNASWTAEAPALAFLLARMLARDPERRLPPGTAMEELELVVERELPRSLRKRLDDDLDVVHGVQFTSAFYAKLFALRPDLRSLFPDLEGQAEKLAAALQYLVDFQPDMRHSTFRALADRHARFNIGPAETEAFRRAFVAQILEVFAGRCEHVDAWNAAFDRSLGAIHAARPYARANVAVADTPESRP